MTPTTPKCVCGHYGDQHISTTEFDLNPCFMAGCDCDDFEEEISG